MYILDACHLAASWGKGMLVQCRLKEHVRVAGHSGPWAVVYTAHGQDALCAARKAIQGVCACVCKGGRISAEGISAAEMG